MMLLLQQNKARLDAILVGSFLETGTDKG